MLMLSAVTLSVILTITIKSIMLNVFMLFSVSLKQTVMSCTPWRSKLVCFANLKHIQHNLISESNVVRGSARVGYNFSNYTWLKMTNLLAYNILPLTIKCFIDRLWILYFKQKIWHKINEIDNVFKTDKILT